MEYEHIIYGRPDLGEFHNHRWIVRNGNTVGAYTLFCRGDGSAYGSSRDYHRIATDAEIEAWSKYRDFAELPFDVQDRMEQEGNGVGYARQPSVCEFHANKLCICDGSSLSEIVYDDKRAFQIAEMMAGTR